MADSFNNPKWIELHIDTGAGKTTIGRKDALDLMLDEDVSVKNEKTEISGVSGKTDAYLIEDVKLVFENHPSEFRKSMHVEFLDSIFYVPSCPFSLLGRDVIDRFDVNYSKRPEKISLQRNDEGDGTYLIVPKAEEDGF